VAIIAPIVSTFDNKGVRAAGTSLGNFSRTVGRQLKNVAVAATGIGIALGAASLKAISAASDLDESISATRQIFGDASDAVLKFADDAALAFGQSKQEALDGALVFGTFGKAAGLAGDDLSGFTNGLLGLSSDIASFRNATPQEAIEAIGAALRGESEPLRRFGVLLDDATLKAEALELGIYDGSGALTQQQKILAAESAIYKQTADAQGDFARTSGGLANQQRILRARLDNVTAQLGVQLLPVALKVANFFADTFIPGVESLADTFAEKGLLGVLQSVWGWVKDNAPRIGNKFLELSESTVAWIQENGGAAIRKLGGWLRSLGSWIIDDALPWLVDKLTILGTALVDWIAPRIRPAIDQLLEWLQALGSWLLDDALPWLVDKAATLGAALIDWIGPRIVPAIEQLGRWLQAVGNWILDDALPWLVEKAIALGDALIGWIGPRIQPALKQLGEWLVAIADWIIFTAAPKLIEQAVKLGAALIGWVFDIAPDVLKGLGSFLLEIGDWIVNDAVPTLLGKAKQLGTAVKDGILDGLAAAGEGALNLGTRIVNGIIDLINSQLIGRLNRAFEFTIPLPFVDDIRVNPPDIPGIPKLAKGGIVTRPTLALIGEAGPEAVVPLGKGGGMGTVNITINGAVDPVSTARQIRQILDQDARRQGRLSVV
jgi:hypothetical protein